MAGYCLAQTTPPSDQQSSVLLRRGHQTGLQIPTGMNVPDNLPLDNGGITCQTCHTGKPGETITNTHSMRVPNDQSQLCMLCHADYAGGLGKGSHPLGGTTTSSKEAAQPSGHSSQDRTRVTCQSCHTPHGPRKDNLLAQGTDSNQLCTSCHPHQSPGHWQEDIPQDHPQNPKFSSKAQRQAITDLGTRLGSDDSLICLSCHKLHSAQPGRYLLAKPLNDGDFCLSCHPGQNVLAKSSHNLGISAPDERNQLGLTVPQSGLCGACHSVHQYARKPSPQPHDESGRCLSCHQPGGGGAKISVTSSHPSLACGDCHDPHSSEHAAFLREDKNDLCADCHDEISETLLSKHDFTDRKNFRNGTGRLSSESSACGFCHDIHRGKGPLMWAATSKQPLQANQLCTNCHTTSRQDAMASLRPLIHPTGPDTVPASEDLELPLFDELGVRDDTGGVACATCHDVHADPEESPALLRLVDDEPHVLCSECHPQGETVPWSLHNSNLLGHAAVTCAPCHAVHANPDAKIAGEFSTFWPVTAPRAKADLCLNCHGPRGEATRLERFSHPDLVMVNLMQPNEPGYLPLAGDDGTLASTGRLTCVTCHLTHGLPMKDAPGGLTPETVGSTIHRASLPMVRHYATPNLCSSCHGQEGLHRFLHFHATGARAKR